MITFCTSEEFTLQIEGVGRTEYNIILTQEIGKDLPVDDIVTELSDNPVKSNGIWDALQSLWVACSTALGLHLDATADAHPATAISVDTSEFGGNLDETVNTVQKLATAVDELEASPVITEPLTPSNDAVAVGDGFQKIGEKVAGLQLQSGSVEDRLDNITDGVITKDANDDILSMMTFGETTVFNRDVNGDIESWENDTHVWNLTKENGEITGWTLTEKP